VYRFEIVEENIEAVAGKSEMESAQPQDPEIVLTLVCMLFVFSGCNAGMRSCGKL
jgi:hypothetical protein